MQGLDVAGDGLAGHQQRVERGGIGVRQQVGENPRRGAGRLGCAGTVLAEAATGRGRRLLVVAENQHACPVPEVGQLRGDDAGDGVLLGGRSCGHAVDVASPAADALLRPDVADRGEGAAYGLDDARIRGPCLTLDQAPRLDAPEQPVVEDPAPVVRCGRLPVLLAEHGPGWQLQQVRMHEAQAGVAEVGVTSADLVPGRRAVLARPHQSLGEPLRQRCRPERGIEEVGGELGEPGRLLRQPRRLVRGGFDQPRHLGVRRQGALLHQGGDPRLVEDRTEERPGELGLAAGHRAWRCGREAEHHRLRQLVEDLAQQLAPHLQEVVTLVEDQGQRTGRPEGLDQRQSVLVEALDLGRPPFALPVVVEHRERLVGQRRERGTQVTTRARVRPLVAVPRADPLALDRRVRGEHDGTPAETPRHLGADEGLARPRRHGHPPARAARSLRLLERSECLDLVLAEHVRTGHRGVRRRRPRYPGAQRWLDWRGIARS